MVEYTPLHMERTRWTTIVVMCLMLASLISVPNSSATQARAMACSGSVCLNEVMPNPAGYDNATWPGGEWMELHNSGTSAVNVLNWEVLNKAGKSLTLDSNSIIGYNSSDSTSWTIQPGGYMVIARNGSSNFYMTNSWDYMRLSDSSGTMVDQASWNSSMSGKSLEEDPADPAADWVQTNSPTPGSANSAASGPYPSDLVISEIMANPWPSEDSDHWPGGEWVEVFNIGVTAMDLSGWSIEDAAGNILPFNSSHLVGSGTSIPANGYRIIAVNSQNSWGVLNNGQESIDLKWPNGTVAMSASWSSTEQGFSLFEDMITQSWVNSPWPTPGQANINPPMMIINSTSTIRFSEVLPNASIDALPAPDGEWLELHNIGNQTLDLMGYSIIDGMGNRTTLDSGSLMANETQSATTIDADGRRLVHFLMDTHLWNGYNHLALLDHSDNVADWLSWNVDPGDNVSLIRGQSIEDYWIPAPWPTPGQPEPGTITPTDSLVLISEVFPDAVGNDVANWPDGEWVELQNVGNSTIDLDNWRLRSGSKSLGITANRLPLQQDSMIQPGDVALVAFNTSSMSLRNSVIESLELHNDVGEVVHSIIWPPGMEGESHIEENDEWVLSPWPTPGEVNPTWPNYSGSHDVSINEVLAYCAEENQDWVELYNYGDSTINLSRWHLTTDSGEIFHIRENRMWNQTTTLVQPEGYAVITLPEWFVSGYGDGFGLSDPNGVEVAHQGWDFTTECSSMGMRGTTWSTMAWMTPGEANPNPTDFAGVEDVIFTRIAVDGDTLLEIRNTANLPADLTGWTLTRKGQSSDFTDSFSPLIIPVGESLSIEPDHMVGDGVFIYESGGTLVLANSSGVIADVVAWGNGPVDVEGWNGPAMTKPRDDVSGIVMIRGDGCSWLPDSNTSEDWQNRWSLPGGSQFCGPTSFSDQATVKTIIGPSQGLGEMVDWIQSAEESIHLHVYQFHHEGIAMELVAAAESGIAVTVVMDEGASWWGDDLDDQERIAGYLAANGVDVLAFEHSTYEYVHSKIGVVDNESVWISSGNIKHSSMPDAGYDGNREWSMIIESDDIAQLVLSRLSYDENPENGITAPSEVEPVSTLSASPITDTVSTANEYAGPVSGELLTCPDDCFQSLVSMIESADEEILLSLQYFELDWSWGWGANPLFEALETKAEEGVKIRMVINGAYLDQEIQDSVDWFNEHGNENWDTAAVIMSSGDGVSKLHNKGAIIDGESVLISSINWGDSAIIRNREMGILLHSEIITADYEAAFWEDWNRLDKWTDSDGDGMSDEWEIANGLNRSLRGLEATLDPDSDGANNLKEFLDGTNPWVSDAIVDPGETNTTEPEENNSNQGNVTEPEVDPNGDDDGDGIKNSIDKCPSTPEGEFTGSDGCTKNQATDDSSKSQDDSAIDPFMLILVLLGLGIIAFSIIGVIRRNNEEEVLVQTEEIDKQWEMPVLDGSTPVLDGSAPVLDGSQSTAGIDMSKFPGWEETLVQSYLDQGWTEDQLAEYYQNEVSQNI